MNELALRNLLSSIVTATDIDFGLLGSEESLFQSGRLDSVNALRLVVELEKLPNFQLGSDFDISQLDSIQKILALFA